jgi:hypothetical protein
MITLDLKPHQIISYLHSRDDYYYHGKYKKGISFLFKKNNKWYELFIRISNNEFMAAEIETCGDIKTPSKTISTTKCYNKFLNFFEQNFTKNLDNPA